MPYRTVREILDLAREAENSASRFYTHAGSLAEDDRAKAMLNDLAREEKKHAEMLEMFDPGAAGSTMVPYEPAVLRELASERKLTAESSLKEVYEMALKWEEMTASFYDEIAQEIRSNEVSEFFSSLRTYELGHIDLINRMYSYYR